MALANSLQKAARNLIDTFGNTSNLYPIASATTSSNEEGDQTVSVWAGTTVINIVDGGSQGANMVQGMMGREQIGEDEKIIRDDVSVSVNDRLSYNGKDYRVQSVMSERVESSDIIHIIRVSQVTDTSQW